MRINRKLKQLWNTAAFESEEKLLRRVYRAERVWECEHTRRIRQLDSIHRRRMLVQDPEVRSRSASGSERFCWSFDRARLPAMAAALQVVGTQGVSTHEDMKRTLFSIFVASFAAVYITSAEEEADPEFSRMIRKHFCKLSPGDKKTVCLCIAYTMKKAIPRGPEDAHQLSTEEDTSASSEKDTSASSEEYTSASSEDYTYASSEGYTSASSEDYTYASSEGYTYASSEGYRSASSEEKGNDLEDSEQERYDYEGYGYAYPEPEVEDHGEPQPEINRPEKPEDEVNDPKESEQEVKDLEEYFETACGTRVSEPLFPELRTQTKYSHCSANSPNEGDEMES
ncbi:uncharacterized protein LOC144101623 [Amblyomma americanum]